MAKDPVSYEKLSKKAKRKENAKRRGSWYGLSPVTRTPMCSGAYRRSEAKQSVRRILTEI